MRRAHGGSADTHILRPVPPAPTCPSTSPSYRARASTYAADRTARACEHLRARGGVRFALPLLALIHGDARRIAGPRCVDMARFVFDYGAQFADAAGGAAPQNGASMADPHMACWRTGTLLLRRLRRCRRAAASSPMRCSVTLPRTRSAGRPRLRSRRSQPRRSVVAPLRRYARPAPSAAAYGRSGAILGVRKRHSPPSRGASMSRGGKAVSRVSAICSVDCGRM